MTRSIQNSLVLLIMASLVLAGLTGRTRSQSEVVGWGSHAFDSRWNSEAFVEISAGAWHTIVRRGDGSAVAWGDNSYGQCNVPALPGGHSHVEVSAVSHHTVARDEPTCPAPVAYCTARVNSLG